MPKRSSKLSTSGSKIAEASLNSLGWTKEFLAIKVELSSATIHNFFACKAVEKDNFIKLCLTLQIVPQEVIDVFTIVNDESINKLVAEVRQKCQKSITQKYGAMRVLDMTYPIEINHIYTNVNILEKITGKQRKSINELTQEFNQNQLDRLGLTQAVKQRVPGLEAVRKYNKLMVLGKPGAGKTTFLRHLALQSISGKVFANYIPVFISIKDFAENSLELNLLDYICQQLANDKVARSEVISLFELERVLLLLDGLDEVQQQNDNRIVREVYNISQQFPNNRFVLTCRIAAKEYTFEQFREVEVADFDQEQIQDFVTNWFLAKHSNLDKQFLKQLQENKAIQELANNPLLLTLLCLEFEDAGDFPPHRTELYQRATHTLLRKWDAKRAIQRDNVYKHLSTTRKESLLSHFALMTFEKGQYFWKQLDVQEYIVSYIKNLVGSSHDSKILLLDSEAVLKSIEAQHGLLLERARNIYSFSHLTFHEYFTAKEIAAQANPENIDDLALHNLVKYVFHKRWHEVFLLTTEMIKNADILLLSMKHQIDITASHNRHLQELLVWTNQKSCETLSPHHPTTIRAVYLCLATGIYILDNTNYPFLEVWEFLEMSHLLESLDSTIQLDFYTGCALGFGMGSFNASLDDPNLALDLNLTHARAQASLLHRIANRDVKNEELTTIILYQADESDCFDEMHEKHPIDDTNFINLSNALYSALKLTENQELQKALVQLYEDLPQGVYEHWDEYYHWYKNDSGTWANLLKELNKKYRNVDYDWQLGNDKNWGTLRAYCYANKLLLDCLHSQCYISRETREYIQKTLLLPFNEIKIKMQLEHDK